jgi:hypothetical protein
VCWNTVAVVGNNASPVHPNRYQPCGLVAQSASLSNTKPTPHEALEAVKVLINYSEHEMEFPEDGHLLVALGRFQEKVEEHCRRDVCAQTGFNMNTE